MAEDSKRRRRQWQRFEAELRKVLITHAEPNQATTAGEALVHVDTLLGDFSGEPFILDVGDRSRPMTPFYKPDDETKT